MKQYILWEQNENLGIDFLSIADKKTYLKYQFLQTHFIEVFPEIHTEHCHINFEKHDLNVLGYEMIPYLITDNRIFQKYNIQGIDIIKILFSDLQKKIVAKIKKDINLYDLSVKKFKRLIIKQFADQVYDN